MSDDSRELTDNALVRRYFAKLAGIVSHLKAVVGVEARGAADTDHEKAILDIYLERLGNSFEALSWKHLLAGLAGARLPHNLAIDSTDSGLPVFREIIELENDVPRAKKILADLPPAAQLRAEMADYILKYKAKPRDLQFALSRRRYLEALRDAALYLPRHAADFALVKTLNNGDRRHLVQWAVYDTLRNLPNIYIMVVDESDRTPLHLNESAQKQVGEALLNQSNSSLKLITIAKGFDADFPRLHPKSLKRIHLGPLYSSSYTRHADRVEQILKDNADTPGEDWIFGLTVETLLSLDSRTISTGLFSTQRQEIYHVDALGPETFEAGASDIDKFVILPLAAYRNLTEIEGSPLANMRKYVVGPDGSIIAHP